MNYKRKIWPDEHVSILALGSAWMGGVVALDIVDNFIILTVSVILVINYIYLYFRY